MDLLFDDVLRLGKVMQVEDRAESLVSGWKAELATIETQTAGLERLRVFLLDGPRRRALHRWQVRHSRRDDRGSGRRERHP